MSRRGGRPSIRHSTRCLIASKPKVPRSIASRTAAVEKASRSGDVRAFNAVSGEHFTGQYVGDAEAHLTGDKGGALTCTMKIEAPANPHGMGQCEDNRGGAYRVQF